MTVTKKKKRAHTTDRAQGQTAGAALWASSSYANMHCRVQVDDRLGKLRKIATRKLLPPLWRQPHPVFFFFLLQLETIIGG